MLKYIILTFSLYQPVHCMESLITLDTAPLSAAQKNVYDLVVIDNPYMLNKENILNHLQIIYNCLALSGKFYGLIRTQTNDLSVPEKVFLDIYSHIYQSTLHKEQEPIDSADQPATLNLKSKYLIDDDLKEMIWSNGYHIISYKNKIYQTIIQNKSEYKETLKSTFINNICNFKLSEEAIKLFCAQFVKLVMKQCQKDNLGQLIESWNFTKIKLCKTENLQPSLYINNLPLSKEWTTENYEK